MGYSSEVIKFFNDSKDILIQCDSVIELGSQDIDCLEINELTNLNIDLSEKKRNSAKKIYEKLGFSEYECIDIDKEHNAHNFDLNYNIQEKYSFYKEFDLVTNCGTSEHIFSQNIVFENLHNLCKEGGLLINILPINKWKNHSFFNYHERFFFELAAANNYELLKFEHIIKKDGNVLAGVIYRKINKKFILPNQGDIYRYRDKSIIAINSILEYFLGKNIKSIAIFGSEKEGNRVYNLLKESYINVKYFIDDFKDDELIEGIKILNYKTFIKNQDVDIIIKGPLQKGEITRRESLKIEVKTLPLFLFE